jgi:Dolichyl-phosphate-mannose-protein mannosyltransferase
MSVARATGVRDPGVEMLIVRLLQAIYSLLVVYFVFRLLERALGREVALIGGVLAALFWAMPVTAVHQLEETVCQVPLLAGCWWWRRAEDQDRPRVLWAALSGMAFGVALILRLPLIAFIAVFAFLALLRPHPVSLAQKLALLAGLALIVVLQGYSNASINHRWWYSFIERLGPMLHPGRMAVAAEGYPNRPPWQYLLTLLAALIPPVSIILLWAAVKGGRKLPLIGLATLAFLLSHSLIANKQERFLLPILPALFILIAAGLPPLADRFSGIYRPLQWYFWSINTALLLVLTFSFSKKDRVAPLLYVYRRHDATGVLIAQLNQTFHVPDYYLGRPSPALLVVERREAARWVPDAAPPINYVVLYSDTPGADSARLSRELGRPLRFLTVIRPSLGDALAHAINPRHNKARTALVYTTS